MKKRILALMLAVVMIVSLASCTPAGNGTETTNAAGSTKVGETTKAAETTKSTEKVELVVWESVDGPDKWIEQAGAAFTAQNPNITIKFVNVELGDSSSWGWRI